MTISEAKRIKDAFYRKSVPSEEDVFIFTEALSFLIEETSNPNYMLELGGYYYGIRNFELALKYYELAAEYKLVDAYDCLGYIYYYGRTGKKDYEKAFHYFSLAADAGNIQAEYKIDENRNFKEDTEKIDVPNKAVNALMRKAIWEHYDANNKRENVLLDINKKDCDIKSIWDSISEYLPIYSLFQSDRKNDDNDSEVQDPLKEAVKLIMNDTDIQKELEIINLTLLFSSYISIPIILFLVSAAASMALSKSIPSSLPN